MTSFVEFSKNELKIIITGSLTFITAMAWNKFFEQIIKDNPKWKKYGQGVYAGCITCFFILVMWGWKLLEGYKGDSDKGDGFYL